MHIAYLFVWVTTIFLHAVACTKVAIRSLVSYKDVFRLYHAKSYIRSQLWNHEMIAQKIIQLQNVKHTKQGGKSAVVLVLLSNLLLCTEKWNISACCIIQFKIIPIFLNIRLTWYTVVPLDGIPFQAIRIASILNNKTAARSVAIILMGDHILFFINKH